MADPIPFSFKCDARWDDMQGEGSERHCTRCHERVVDLSALTREQAATVLATPGVCVNYIVVDGQVAYASTPRPVVPPRHPTGRRGRILRFAAAVSTLVAPQAALAAAPADDASTWDQVKSWVAAWFAEPEPEGCAAPTPAVVDTGDTPPPPRLGGQPVPQPIRHGGKPKATPPPSPAILSLRLPNDLAPTSVEARCGDSWRERTSVREGVARFPNPPLGVACEVHLKGTSEPLVARVPASGNYTCTVDDHALSCILD